jgi:iron complex transport system ATP-binding protein
MGEPTASRVIGAVQRRVDWLVRNRRPEYGVARMCAETAPLLLELDRVKVTRGPRSIIDGVDLRVRAGQIVALVGPNGSGKTTLLKAAAGLLPFEGAIALQGCPLSELDRKERAKKVAYVPQHSPLDAALSVFEVVAMGRLMHRATFGRLTPDDQQAIDEAIMRADVKALRHRHYNHLSYGERRRVLLARALATHAPLLLLDEPTAALDIRHVLELFSILRAGAAEGIGVLMVLHQLNEVVDIADEAALLHHGRFVCQGPVDEVIAEAPVRDVYGVEILSDKSYGYALSKRAD